MDLTGGGVYSSVFVSSKRGYYMKGSIIRTLLFQLGSVFVLSTVLIGYFWIDGEYENLAQENARYRAEYLETQKTTLRSEVLKIKGFLLSEKARAERLLEQQIKQRVNEAHAIATHLYEINRDRLDDTQIQRMIREALRSIRFNEGRGYYFVTSLNGIEHLFPPKPAFEGKHAEAIFSEKGVKVVHDMIDIVDRDGEGFLRYNWPRPDDQSRYYRKYSYVKLFAPYGWIIGTGDYLSEIEANIREEIFRNIASVKYGLNDEGYFFINSYQGDLYVTNGEYFGGRKNIWEITDVNGKKVVQENAALAMSRPEGGFSEYVWKKPSGEEAAKISFIVGMDEWNIFIGSGAYTDTLEKEIKRRENDLASRLKQRIVGTLGVYLVAVILIALAAFLIGRKLSLNFWLFQRAFDKAVDSRVRIDTDRVHFKEFRILANSCNGMIDALNLQTERLRYQAYHDHLTALPNRLKGMEHLAKVIEYAREEASTLALLYIDIDDFKEINDTLGHSTGDRLLQTIAERIAHTVREGDIVARLGGDEFMVITGLLNQAEDAQAIAGKLLRVLKKPFSVDDNAFHISASIGLCLFPEDGNDAETMLRNADSAMYQAKRSGKNSFMHYHDRMTQQAAERAALLDDLRMAVAASQFELFFQPHVDVERSVIVGVEALIRWHHPDKGIIGPGRFIPLAESSGLIVPIGEWVLRQACHCFAHWRAMGYELDYIAVNLSARQLQRESLPQLISEVLDDTGLTPEVLELEVTESLVMEITAPVAKALERLKQRGLGLVIDDFGTGYSSLSSLKQLPINKLKIDRSFVRDLEVDDNDKAIVKAIIGMGSSLGLTVVAEGVEEQAQAALLLSEGCHIFQGYYYSRPLPEPAFLDFLKQYPQNIPNSPISDLETDQ